MAWTTKVGRGLWLAGFGILLAACTGGALSPNSAIENPQAETAVVDESSETAGSNPSSAASTNKPLEPTPTTVVGVDPNTVDLSRYEEYEIITLLPPDGIPAIDNPQFLGAEEAWDFYDPDELVIGVEFNGDARAYSIPHLSSHEIVNDTVGGVKIAVTW